MPGAMLCSPWLGLPGRMTSMRPTLKLSSDKVDGGHSEARPVDGCATFKWAGSKRACEPQSTMGAVGGPHRRAAAATRLLHFNCQAEIAFSTHPVVPDLSAVAKRPLVSRNWPSIQLADDAAAWAHRKACRPRDTLTSGRRSSGRSEKFRANSGALDAQAFPEARPKRHSDRGACRKTTGSHLSTSGSRK